MAYNKVIFGNKVLIDLTNDTVKPEFLIKGKTAHDKSGNVITGELNAEEPKIQSKIVIPTIDGKTVSPDEGFDYLSQVEVKPIPKKEEANDAGGITVTIAG